MNNSACTEEIYAANLKSVDILNTSQPVRVGVERALDVIPRMQPNTILHAGPPIEFDDMCGAMKGAIAGALILEGLAADYAQAISVAESGEIEFGSCNDYNAVAPMAGIISASMPVCVVQDMVHGCTAYTPFNEGSGRVLQQGANDEATIAMQRNIIDELAPIMAGIIGKMGRLDIKDIIAQSLHMGDECHNRTKAATSLFLNILAPYLLQEKQQAAARIIDFIYSNNSFFLNYSMAACKCGLDAAHGVPMSSIVTAMSRNGVEFGIKLSGLPAGEWYTGPAQNVIGIYSHGFSSSDANRDMGDSAIVETNGLGGFAMSAAPAIARYIGGTAEDAINCSQRMYEITDSESADYTVPASDFRGLPLGINALLVVEKQVLPIISTAIAHKDPGIGQVGAGISTPPIICFDKAVQAFKQRYSLQ